VVSAIGHESDTPLLDLVADVRASTPTDAAKRIVPDVEYEVSRVVQARDRVRAAIVAKVVNEQRSLDQLRARPVLAAPESALDTQADLLVSLTDRTSRAVRQRIDRASDDVTHLRERVRALSPAATLARGYAVVQTADQAVVRNPDDAPAGTELVVRLAEGTLAARSEGPHGEPRRVAP
jgi:exodeoxyribonuclease VII large subunit